MHQSQGEILGVGVTHWPKYWAVDEDMIDTLRRTLTDPGIPEEMKDPASWPEEMRAEWEDPEAPARHRAALREGFARARQAIDEFNPDVVLVWGDDQYENFTEDIIPAFSVLAYDDITLRPWEGQRLANVWGEPEDFEIVVRGAPQIARDLTAAILENDIDVAYAYKPLHHNGLAHAFANTVLYLDQDRVGFDYPVVSLPVNCYGRRVISHRGRRRPFGAPPVQLDPPSPSPARCMAFGAAVARSVMSLGLRAAVVASSSWSHAFLVDENWHLWPDVASDRELYEALARGDYAFWRGRTLADLERSGQQEMLNWYCLLGAMEELGRRPAWTMHAPTYIFNSTKTFAIFE